MATCLVGSNIIGQYTCILTNNAQELTPYRFEFKCDTNRIRKYFLSMPRFEPGSLGWMTNALANSTMSLVTVHSGSNWVATKTYRINKSGM